MLYLIGRHSHYRIGRMLVFMQRINLNAIWVIFLLPLFSDPSIELSRIGAVQINDRMRVQFEEMLCREFKAYHDDPL